MTVNECFEYYRSKSKNSNRIPTRIWMCPSIVNSPKVGKDYTREVPLTSNPPESLYNVEVTKHWVESDAICVIYRNSDELMVALNQR